MTYPFFASSLLHLSHLVLTVANGISASLPQHLGFLCPQMASHCSTYSLQPKKHPLAQRGCPVYMWGRSEVPRSQNGLHTMMNQSLKINISASSPVWWNNGSQLYTRVLQPQPIHPLMTFFSSFPSLSQFSTPLPVLPEIPSHLN